jgi:hypothetical protein
MRPLVLLLSLCKALHPLDPRGLREVDVDGPEKRIPISSKALC